MGISYNPKIVTDGLVLALDAANIKSYNSGISTTTWFDRSGNGNNGTLTNGPIHSSESVGYNGGVQFDGTGDFLSITYDSSLKITENNDWTIEFWMYASGPQSAVNSGIYAQDASFSGLVITADTARNIEFTSSTTGSSWNYLFQTIGTYTDNTWNHVAVTKSGTTLRTFFNGSLGYTTTSFPSSSFTRTDNPEIGRYSTNYFNGFISNFRLVKGTALYTANFTPPTAPLTAVTNTVLLTCQGNTIADASSNAHTITANGDAVAVGSIFPGDPIDVIPYFSFDGTNDYVETSSGMFNCNSDFTFNSWVNADVNNTIRTIISSITQGSIQIRLNTSNQVQIVDNFIIDVGIFTGFTASASTWYNICVVRSSDEYSLYVNGAFISSFTNANVYSIDANAVGDTADVNERWDGKISVISAYNRALTASEVQQNFNALRGRYGI